MREVMAFGLPMTCKERLQMICRRECFGLLKETRINQLPKPLSHHWWSRRRYCPKCGSQLRLNRKDFYMGFDEMDIFTIYLCPLKDYRFVGYQHILGEG